MLDVGLVHAGWPMTFDEFGDAEEPLPNVGCQLVDFSLDTTVEDLHAPRHMLNTISKIGWTQSGDTVAAGYAFSPRST